jgi:radical SAM protein with 4Fe4S-binding SPASM domain
LTVVGDMRAAPRVVFWELTRRCPLRCFHCRTVEAPTGRELTAREAMRVADQLVDLCAGTVVLTGGEPTAREGWERIAERLSRGVVRVRLFTSGFGANADLVARAIDAGVAEFAVSIDGPREIHDSLRPEAGAEGRSSFAAAVELVQRLAERGAATRVVTAVNRINAPYLAEMYELVKGMSVPRWQLQLCRNLGRSGARSDELMCAPSALEEMVRVLLAAAKDRIVLAPLHCTVGYMTAEEPVLRNRESSGSPVWRGCGAGVRAICVTAEGGVKGCAALPDEFVTASVLERSIAEIWNDDRLFPYARAWSREVLAGACAACAFGETCRAGCPAVAYSATGSVGLNPFCLKLVRGRRG